MNINYVHKYKNEGEWEELGAVAINELKTYIAQLQGTSAKRGIKSVIDIAEQLSKLGRISQVQEQKYVIEKVMTEEFWEEADIFDIESVREALMDLIKYLQREGQIIYYTKFEDIIISEEKNASMYNVNDLRNYKKKVEFYLNEHKDDIAIYKLRNNKKITQQDLKSLEEVLFRELGSKADYEKGMVIRQ